MPDQVLYDQITRIFSERLNIHISSQDADLFETGVLDSLSFVDLLMHVEQQFDIRISADELELENFLSVQKIAAFVAAHDGPKKAAAA
jgi:D-alanine--poly(phosphoribitol) ligase subunit 2